VVLALVIAVAGPRPASAAVQTAAPDFDGLSAYIERSLDDWGIPGLAIAVVKDDSVVFARGFGVRALGPAPEPVDERTVFAIGSASKAFTAAAIATLVDEGTLDWNDPAALHLPGLTLHDAYVTRELTVLDLLTHRSGLPRGDFVWYGSEYDRAEVVRRVRYLEPQSSFRSAFGYQNIMYIAAGEVLLARSGLTWESWVASRIFEPLGMDATNTSTRDLEGLANVATPHQEIDGEVRPIAWRNIDNAGPAGSINSNVLDMAQWVRMHLNGGRYEGREVLTAAAVDAMQTHRTIVQREGGWRLMSPDAAFMTYGLGWFMHDFRGRMIVEHGGNIDGMHALVGMLPAEDAGIVILTNLYNSLTTALMYRVFDAYVGAPETDWSARLRAARDSMQAAALQGEAAFTEARVEGTTPSLERARYAGAYRHRMYGDARVSLEEGGLVLSRGPAFVGDLEHWHHDTFEVTWRDAALGRTWVTFQLDAAGEVDALDVRGLATYERVPEEGAS
jgi:CubicO group peptidase (beta-lactamase class C family)